MGGAGHEWVGQDMSGWGRTGVGNFIALSMSPFVGKAPDCLKFLWQNGS